jgi:hypothetical protein
MRENMPELKQRLNGQNQWSAFRESQVLIHTQMPCGAAAECGVCAVTTRSSWKLACKDGPVFDMAEI